MQIKHRVRINVADRASKASRSSSCEVKPMKADTHNWPRDG